MAEFDTVIHGGTIIDGSGAPGLRGDLGINGDRISRIGSLDASSGDVAIDAAGQMIAPGCVDVHNHSDGWLLREPHFLPKISQGVTTEVIMADGISYAPVAAETTPEWIHYLRSINALTIPEYTGWETIAEYMQCLDGHTAQNAIAHIPYANVRTLIMGWRRDPADDVQKQMIQAEVRRGMEDGAVGISTGIDYVAQSFCTTDEIVSACQAMAEYNGLYVTHVRYKKGLIEGIQEAVEIGKRAGVAVHISHLKARTPELAEQVLDYIDRVAVNEVDFSFDVYPYLPGSTMLHSLLPYDVWEDGPLRVLPKLAEPRVRRLVAATMASLGDLDGVRLAWCASKENSQYQGLTVGEYVRHTGKSAADAVCDLLMEENLAVLAVFGPGTSDQDVDSVVDPFLQHDRFMLGSDGIYYPDGVVHPRVYGSVPRLLGPLVRERKLFTLEDAVRKAAGYPAERFGLTDRGLLREGAFADLFVFNPDTIRDTATYTDPHQIAEGIDTVMINGQLVLSAGAAVGAEQQDQPGRALRYRSQ
ncbi:MAG: D-aminoacylase [Fuerstiella sp.]|nr:D-aminoacylase [Fuerstiella sp.]